MRLMDTSVEKLQCSTCNKNKNIRSLLAGHGHCFKMCNDIALCLIILSISVRGTTGKIITTPINRILLVGDELVLTCTSNSDPFGDLIWYRLHPNGTKIQSLRACLLFTNIQPPYEFNGTGNTCELRVATISADEAGQYECYQSGSPVDIQSSALVVLKEAPSLFVATDNVTTGENVTLQFLVQYAGNMTPEIVWNPSDSITTFAILTSNSPERAIFSIIITSRDEGNYSFTCAVTFKPTGLSITDTNEVTYSSGNSVTVVFNSPGTAPVAVNIDSVVVAPPNRILLAGDELIMTCTSDTGNYDEFTWSRIDPGGSQIMSLRGCLLATEIPPPYSFVGAGGSCELHVTSITTAEAGQYQCHFSGAPVSRHSSALVVLDVPPSLNIDNDNVMIYDNVTLEFLVHYAGGMTPEVVCRSYPSGIIEFDLPPANVPGGILFSKFITTDTEGIYILNCDVMFRPTGLVITDTSEPTYASVNNVTVKFKSFPNSEPAVAFTREDCLPWIIVLINACVVLFVIIVPIILRLLKVITWRVETGCGAGTGIVGILLAIIIALAGIIVGILIATGFITTIERCKKFIAAFTIVLSLAIAGLIVCILQVVNRRIKSVQKFSYILLH